MGTKTREFDAVWNGHVYVVEIAKHVKFVSTDGSKWTDANTGKYAYGDLFYSAQITLVGGPKDGMLLI